MTYWLAVWIDAYLIFKEHQNHCTNKARAVDAQLRVLSRIHGFVPEWVRAVYIGCIQAVALYSSEIWWDPKDIARPGQLQLLLNRKARLSLRALPRMQQGLLMRDSELTTAPVALDSKQH